MPLATYRREAAYAQPAKIPCSSAPYVFVLRHKQPHEPTADLPSGSAPGPQKSSSPCQNSPIASSPPSSRNQGRRTGLRLTPSARGLGVRSSANGTRTFIVQWTDPATTQKRREPLGAARRCQRLLVDQHWAAMRVRLGDVAKGIDPRVVRLAARAKAEAEQAEAKLTLEALVDEWAKLHLAARRPRYRAEAVRAIKLAFVDYLRNDLPLVLPQAEAGQCAGPT